MGILSSGIVLVRKKTSNSSRESLVKVVCIQENLSKALSIVNRAVATRSSLPVLANVLIATDSSMLKLSATNMEISTTVLIGCKTETEGAVTVPAHRQ